MTIRKLLIANRGEIAVRVIRAARELGIGTVQAHSTADAASLAVQLADAAVAIGPPQAAKSYLNIEAVLNAARMSGCDAVHPGYGFLSENAAFAQAVENASLIFVGPKADTIRRMGDKVAAREAAIAAGVPTVPGSPGRVDDPAAARAIADALGYPVMIKAAAGGGGRGIRIVNDGDELDRLFPQASAEAKAAFGDGGLYIEKLIPKARHIEVQVLGDGHRVIHCFERECSLQRRRQKVWEEAPSPVLSAATRAKLCASAVQLTQSVNYRGAGTLEYLYDERDGAFYFIEMNTRIQVEHPVTEMITGIDLVREMLRIAGGEPLRLQQEDIALRGHAIEVRINAEDPAKDFMPFPGKVESLRVPGGGGTRFDTMLYAGYQIPPFYDSLLGKLIVWDESRPQAIARLSRALGELDVVGVATTKPLHQALAADPDVQSASFHTRWLEDWLVANASSLGAIATPQVEPSAPALAPVSVPPPLSAATATGGNRTMQTRYSFGGDEHIFVECDEEMSLEAFFKSLSITNAVKDAKIKGVTEICPANASFQIKFDPDVIKPDAMLSELKKLEAASSAGTSVLKTRIIEIPVLYNDPWTHETLMKFRERHQDPKSTDIEYAARINNLGGVDDFVRAHSSSPWFVSMVGFVAGLPFLYQMVDRKRQLEVPKYLRPRTDTPKLTVGHGGCFGCIYSVRGAGGYQMFGITPMPIYDPNQKIGYLRDFMCLFKPGDIVKWKPIDRVAYDQTVADVESGRFVPLIRDVTFSLADYQANIDATNKSLMGALYGH
jgi:acetyl-CoA carboxylase, biotin carboxylase subunit